MTRNRTTGCRTHACLRGWRRRSRTRRWCLVNRPWPGLRNNHARGGWLGCGGNRRSRQTRRTRRRRCGHGGNSHRRRCRSMRNCDWGLRWCRRHRTHGWRCHRGGNWRNGRRNGCSRFLGRRCNNRRTRNRSRRDGRSHRRGRRRRCSRRRLSRRRYHNRPRRNWRYCWARGKGRDRRSFLLLSNRLQHIARTRDVRQINLGPDFFFAAQGARGTRRRGLCFRRAADVGPHFFCFMLFQRTGMGLLLRHPDER